MGRLGNCGDVGADGVIIATFELAHVDDHIDFIGAGFDGIARLGNLGGGRGGTQREPDHGAGLDVGAGKPGGNAGDPVRVHADRRRIKVLRLLDHAVDIACGGFRLKQRVIHELGKCLLREVHEVPFRVDHVAAECGCTVILPPVQMRGKHHALHDRAA